MNGKTTCRPAHHTCPLLLFTTPVRRHLYLRCRSDGSCYLSFPYYYTIADVLRDSQYIPTDAPPIPDRVRVSLSARSSLAPATDKPDGDHKHEHTQPRRVHVTLTGPDHMVVVTRDGIGGVLKQWSITPDNPDVPPPRHDGVRYVQVTSGNCGGPSSMDSERDVNGELGIDDR